MSAIPKKIKRKNEKSKASDESCEPQPSGYTEGVSAEINLSPKEAERYYSEQNKTYSLQHRIFWVNIATLLALGLYTFFTYRMLCATNKNAETASKQLEMIDRPWIEDTVTPGFDLDANNGAFSWAVTVRASNIGHSVAASIFPRVELIAPVGADFIDGPRKRVIDLCDDASRRLGIVKNDPKLWDSSVFPGHYADYPQSPILWPKDIKKAAVDGGEKIGQSITLMLVGCLAYDYPTALRIHRTGFIYLLVNKSDVSIPEPSQISFPVGKTVSKDKIVMLKKDEFAD